MSEDTAFLRTVLASPADATARLVSADRLDDRIAVRTSKEPVARTPASDLGGAVRELDAVIAWCEALVPAPQLKLKKDEAA